MIRRIAALGAVLSVGVLASPASATSQVSATRLSGPDRYGTAHAVAVQTSFTGDTVVVTSGLSYPDALSAASIAAPVVLTGAGALPTESAKALDELRATKSKAIIVGGTATVSDAVAEQVRGHGYTVRRIAGGDRFSTAAFVAQEHTPFLIGGEPAAAVVNARSFSDALAAAPSGLPLLLTESDSLPAATKSALDAMGVRQVVIVGGTNAVSNATQSALTAGNRTVTRVAAATATETAVAMAEYEIGTLRAPGANVMLASPSSFADGITGGALGVVLRAPVILAGATLPPASQNFLDAHSKTITKVYVVGGTSAVSDAAQNAAVTAATTVQND